MWHFLVFFLFSLGKKVRYMVKSSSVTKRHILVGMDKAFGIVFTHHQWQHSDRKYPLSTQFEKPKINQFLNGLVIHSKVVNAKKCLYHHFGGVLAWKVFCQDISNNRALFGILPLVFACGCVLVFVFIFAECWFTIAWGELTWFWYP